MTWLVTAFEPFAGAQTNSSLIVARELEKLNWQGKIHFHYPVPVTFADAWPSVQSRARSLPKVDGILALGQADPRRVVSLERVARNWIAARIPDNAGAQPIAQPIQKGPEFYSSQIPWQEFARPEHCEFSDSAGTFVCNAVMYKVLEWAQVHEKLGGFVHLPLVSSQVDPVFSGLPQLEDATVIQVAREILEFLVQL